MKLVTLITALAMGASVGAAAAEPDRPVYGDRTDQYRRPHLRDGWVTLTAPLTNYTNRQFIRIDRNVGRLEGLRLEVASGRVFVRQVLINFVDGTQQKVLLSRMLRAGEHINLDVPGRAKMVSGMVVYTDPARGRRGRGQYQISGNPVRPQYGNPYPGTHDYWRR